MWCIFYRVHTGELILSVQCHDRGISAIIDLIAFLHSTPQAAPARSWTGTERRNLCPLVYSIAAGAAGQMVSTPQADVASYKLV